jgi:hypothetical protein
MSSLPTEENVLHRHIQHQLMQWYRFDDTHRQMAEGCLRCLISHLIKDYCLKLEQEYGQKHDFTSAELFAQVLVDRQRLRTDATRPNEQSLTTRILQTFDPNKSSLSTWTRRVFKSDRLVKDFLLSHEIELVTDWMILCYTTPGKLQKVLTYFGRTQAEIDQALQLLNTYHEIYRNELLQKRKAGSKSRYPDPTPEQLRKIAEKLSSNRTISSEEVLKNEEVLKKLQKLASLLREYRFSRPLPSAPYIEMPVEDDEPSEMLASYRLQFDRCLTQSVKQVIQNRFDYLQRRGTERSQNQAQKYLTALRLFHCSGLSLKEIAHQLGFTDQPHLSRFLELKRLRNDIGRSTLSCLLNYVTELKKCSLEPDKLRNLEALLDEQIDSVIQKAEKEVHTGHNRVMNSQLAQTICQELIPILPEDALNIKKRTAKNAKE